MEYFEKDEAKREANIVDIHEIYEEYSERMWHHASEEPVPMLSYAYQD